MSKEKQIDEMAKAMCFGKEHCTVTSCTEVNCETTWLAENLYNAGYRKQSEGEWSHGVNDTVKCSICRRRMLKIYCMNFCPNCGARMKGGAE